MNAGDVASVECPCCTGELYRQVLVDAGNGQAIWARVKGTTEIESDREGHFMKCPQCSNRIALHEVPDGPSEKGLQISPNQKCDQKLP